VSVARSELSVRASAIADALADWPRRRVTLRELWHVLDLADPASRTDTRRRDLLAGVLTELAEAGVLRLPSPGSFDRTEMPHLPRFVTVPLKNGTEPSLTSVVWHPSLSWVPDARLTPAQHDALEQINRWLYTNRDPLVVPMRERSLEIFGHEKRLERLLTTGLFAPDRLTLDLLRTRRALVRFTTEHVGDGDGLLVVENSDTFDSVVTALSRDTGHRIGTVGWGAGSAFEASVLSIARLDRPIRTVCYFGDLDEKGLQIPANASTLTATAGLPEIRPAVGLYQALLELATPQDGQRRLTAHAADALARWLAPHHRQLAATHLVAGGRLAQEAVGLSYLLTNHHWLDGLTG